MHKQSIIFSFVSVFPQLPIKLSLRSPQDRKGIQCPCIIRLQPSPTTHLKFKNPKQIGTKPSTAVTAQIGSPATSSSPIPSGTLALVPASRTTYSCSASPALAKHSITELESGHTGPERRDPADSVIAEHSGQPVPDEDAAVAGLLIERVEARDADADLDLRGGGEGDGDGDRAGCEEGGEVAATCRQDIMAVFGAMLGNEEGVVTRTYTSMYELWKLSS